MLCSNWLRLLQLNVPMFVAEEMWLYVVIICAYVLRLYVRYLLRLNVAMCCDYMWLFVAMCVMFVATECL